MKAEAVAVEAAGQRYSQVDTFVYLGSTISSVGDVGPEIKRRTGYAWNCFLKYSRAVYDNPYIAVADKVRFLKAEVLEVMLYGCVTWTLSPGDFDKLREAHRGMLLRCLNAYTSTRATPDYHMLSYLEVLLRTDCECIEATVMKRILHYAGRVARMHDDRLPSRSTIGGVGDTTIPSPGWSTKQPLPGIGLHDPLHGRQACPEFTSFYLGVGRICPREELFSYRPLPKRGQICDIPDPPNR